MNEPRYPGIYVELVGQDGNAFMIVGRVARSLRNAGVTETEIKEFRIEAMSGDYDHLLQTCLKWVNEGSPKDDWDEDGYWDEDAFDYDECEYCGFSYYNCECD